MLIKYFVLDVDGTLTDGKIHISASGELFKNFHVRDGYGIKDILPILGIIPIVITGRESFITKLRCNELDIHYLRQGASDKVKALYSIFSEMAEEDDFEDMLRRTAYMGDDIVDLECMNLIKKYGGITACPADAVYDVRMIVDYISQNNGGNGAVREFIDYLKEQIIHGDDEGFKNVRYKCNYPGI